MQRDGRGKLKQFIVAYVIYCDESVKSGKYFSNFYGGVLVPASRVQPVSEELLAHGQAIGLTQEIKWNKVSAGPYLEKYKAMMSAFFAFLQSGDLRVRIFFRKNSFEARGLTGEQKARQFTLLYYQFLKHSFGLVDFEHDGSAVPIGLRLDLLPEKESHVTDFKAHLGRLRFPSCYIDGNDIAEVDSKQHILLQCLDVVLGAMAFRLNDQHKEKPEGASRRGRKTIAKEKLYRHIAREVQQLHPHRLFNFGDSTGLAYAAENWDGAYRHWSFRPKGAQYISGRSKK